MSASNGLPHSLPLLVRPVLQVSCEVHHSFQSPSPVDEYPQTIAKISSPGGGPVLLPISLLENRPVSLPGGDPVPIRGHRPVLPIKPLVLCTRPSTSLPATDNGTKNNELQQEINESSKAVSFLPLGRPVPPVKPPGLFARLSGISEVQSDAVQLVRDTEDVDNEDEEADDNIDDDGVKIFEEWDDECDDYEDDCCEEDAENISEEV